MTPPAAPLIATSDLQLLDDAQRWCAAVGASPVRAHDLASVRRAWRGAAAVVVGDDLLEELSRARLPRRDHVVVVARGPDPCWDDAMELGAVAVCGPGDDRVVDLLSAALAGTGEACVVAVVGGVGGAGASTFAAALAVAAARRRLRPLVIDADPLGGGVDLVLGAERVDGVRWDDLGEVSGRLDASLADVLPARHGVTHLGWARDSTRRLPASWSEVLSAAGRGFDLVVVDLPRHLDMTGLEIVGRSVLTLVVVPEELSAVSAAGRVLAEVRRCAPTVGVVTVARPGGLGPAAVGSALDVPLVGRVRPDRRLRQAVDRGAGPGRSRSLRRTAAAVLDAVGLEPA